MPAKAITHNPNRPRAERLRQTSAQRGYGGRWQRYRDTFLAANPLCVRHLAQGQTEPATVVDHITPHKGNEELFWDPDNHQALCKLCHDRKTATEDGGFGHART